MRSTAWILLGFCLSLSPLAKAADPEKLASLEVSIDDAKLVKDSTGIRTLFVILYDTDSPMPMPYGAMKVDLKTDAKGVIYKGDLTTANVQAMGRGGIPKNLRIKARLDKDGSAGKDQPGDFVGSAEKLKLGDKAKIVINTAI